MADMEPFTLIEEPRHPRTTGGGPPHLFDNFVDLNAAKTADHDLQYAAALRDANPDMIVTTIPGNNVNLRAFAAAGFATCDLDTKTDSFFSWRGFIPPANRHASGHLGESVYFAKYHYRWNQEDFILYTVLNMQYVLKERQSSEHALGPSSVTDKLIMTVGEWQTSDDKFIWVFDNYWQRSKTLYAEVEKASWEKVILDEGMKKDLTSVAERFFDSREIYEELGVPWKRGLIFGGPPGNGKTISIKALMHTLLFTRKASIPTLYVKSAPGTYYIRNVFAQARALSPCMLVLEDIETIVTPQTRSYFFNEMDGLENNDGLFVVASTNFLDKLDPGLSKRPSRFDRTYIFQLPNEHERTLYCEFWRRKLSSKPDIKFPHKLCPAMAHVTPGFSFAFMQECFVATLLILARDETRLPTEMERLRFGNDDLEDYVLWRVFKQQADMLRKQIKTDDDDDKPDKPKKSKKTKTPSPSWFEELLAESASSAESRDKSRGDGTLPALDGGVPAIDKPFDPAWFDGSIGVPQPANGGMAPGVESNGGEGSAHGMLPPLAGGKNRIINSAAWALI